MNIYVASSWRNEFQPVVVKWLSELGHDVYDFRNPHGKKGFSWSDVTDAKERRWSSEFWRNILNKPRARDAFATDMAALSACDVCVLVLPCGRSSHLELGWCAGQGKQTVVFVPRGLTVEPDLMVSMTTGGVKSGLYELKEWLYFVDRSVW